MNMFSTNELMQLFPKQQNAETNVVIEEVFRDSRQTVTNGLFIPIIGENFDGHAFISQAIEQGAVATLSSRTDLEGIPEDFPVFFVEDTVEALQQLASFYCERVDPVVVGITGSNGKTTTKEIVSNCLATSYKVWKTEGNLNNHIGLPLTVLSMATDTEALILEMGMSNFGEIEELSHIVKPDYAIITNIGESHIEYLGSREGIAKAKLEITSGLKDDGLVFIDGDEPLLKEAERQVSCGFSPVHDYYISEVEQMDEHTSFNLNGEPIQIPLLGKHQAKNAAYAFALSDKLGISISEVKHALEQLTLPSMRFEQHKAENGSVLINDAYNASATSMMASIDVLKHMNYTTRIVVLGDILELGPFSEQEHKKVGEVMDDSIDAVYTVGDASEYILKGIPDRFNGEVMHFDDKNKLIPYLRTKMEDHTAILFKASRGLMLEEVVNQLLK
ncbi:UDP-N-acetylmuramoyl-tripeptide--D-alanyl-D-alanine ligase [Tenuibacillus multivorans]|uniref:UDP-N-acetylmuramoyl-tripeptide--D-alanyl-D-alanine ligase n=1 Tax=Tenuibacillus multivorans TaxID=237069 RepID=A0A1G9Y6K4_9BACI|nr:UDP-N-acetylmuramoyl-tripeptide--D-alanyl-D-alanine ligase [Tenuibacillus multivorans]GEL75969.1 UDP-N-acetylmuramoyl-tripeptide--D-alanyl-D-alanine ligase [Tenuibacillus multivorans]SDN04729.1 UDP-N-acetylmuramoyl-tripeptide--D-alanyl-D-alanine ligase [Tenuibacillus multivorans]